MVSFLHSRSAMHSHCCCQSFSFFVRNAFYTDPFLENKADKSTSTPLPLNLEGLVHFARRARLQSNIFLSCECASTRSVLLYRNKVSYTIKKDSNKYVRSPFYHYKEITILSLNSSGKCSASTEILITKFTLNLDEISFSLERTKPMYSSDTEEIVKKLSKYIDSKS